MRIDVLPAQNGDCILVWNMGQVLVPTLKINKL